MGFEELKSEIDAVPVVIQEQLRVYLNALRQNRNVERLRRFAEKIDGRDAGNWMDLDEAAVVLGIP